MSFKLPIHTRRFGRRGRAGNSATQKMASQWWPWGKSFYETHRPKLASRSVSVRLQLRITLRGAAQSTILHETELKWNRLGDYGECKCISALQPDVDHRVKKGKMLVLDQDSNRKKVSSISNYSFVISISTTDLTYTFVVYKIQRSDCQSRLLPRLRSYDQTFLRARSINILTHQLPLTYWSIAALSSPETRLFTWYLRSVNLHYLAMSILQKPHLCAHRVVIFGYTPVSTGLAT